MTCSFAGGCSILKSSLPSSSPLTSVNDVEFIVVAQLASPPTFVSPSHNATLLLTAIGSSVLVINTVNSTVTTRLEGHVGNVTDAVFCGQTCECAKSFPADNLFLSMQYCNIVQIFSSTAKL